jgi:glycosyltransferase involved in cell wall biosynthesis
MTLAAAAVADEVRSRGFDWLQVHFAGYPTEWAMALSELLDVPFGATWHAVGIWKDRNALPEKLRAARLTMTCTRANADHLARLAPDVSDRVHLVYHGLDLDSLGPPTPFPESSGPTRIVAIGRLIPKKGFSDLIEAVALCAANGLDVRLEIIGDGPLLGPLKELASARTKGRVSFAGSVPNQQVWASLERAHALAMPSVLDPHGDRDGIPNVILEALASARPVIGTDVSGIPEVVRTGETGWLVPASSPGAIADAIGDLVRDPAKAALMGQNGRVLIETTFDVGRDVRQQLDLIGAART